MNLNADLDRTAAQYPERTALVYVSAKSGREESLTYRELRKKILRAAAAFRSQGIGKGDRVAIIHRNDPAFIVVYFGLLRLGAVAVPMNFMIQKPDELRFMLEHCGAKAIVTQGDMLPGVLGARESLPGLARVWTTDQTGFCAGVEEFWPLVESCSPLEQTADISAQDTVAILYTSGTTGFPKGVMLTHANLISNRDACLERLAVSGDDAWMAVLPMFHTFGWTLCVLLPLKLGAKIVIARSVAPPEPWLEQMGRQGVSILACVPQIYVLLSGRAAGYQELILREGYFHNLRLCISGAAPLSPQVHKEFLDAFGLEIMEGYGLTETSPVAAINPLGRPKVGSVGVALKGVSIRIVDKEGNALPVGEEGEILIQGPNVMKGYYRDEEATRQAIDPDGWFRSGDIGVIDQEGYVHIRDRKKDMVIVNGLKVFPAQVEKVLLTHPNIQEAAVVGIPTETGDERIKAFIVPRAGARVDPMEIQEFCREKFDPYKRPKDIEILKELPKNALQKTLKRVLRQRELQKQAR